MGIVKLSLLKDHLSTSSISQELWFPTVVLLSRFETISKGNCGFGHIYWRIFNGKLHFLCSVCNKLYKLGNMKKIVRNIFQAVHSPTHDFSANERIVGTKTRISFIQH